MKKIIDLKKYKQQQEMKKMIKEFDDIQEQHILYEPDPVIRKGYKNFKRLIEKLDEKYEDDNS
jgi:hypothetical protein